MRRATFIGFAAIGMWSLLALMTSASGRVPPFQLAAMTFTLGAAAGLAAWPFGGSAMRLREVPGRAWLYGIGGLAGYHMLYFSALRAAPAAEASLIAYLWPLFIVLGSALMPGEKLRWHHAAGAISGLFGTAILVTGGKEAAFGPAHGWGYFLAFCCALLWAAYSLMMRRYPAVPTRAVTVFCTVTALLSLGLHVVAEPTIWPQTPGEWLAIAGLGLMPVGAAFYAWDHGVKHGDIQILGAASYAAPLLSTLALLAAGLAQPGWPLLAACVLIAGGAMLASKDMFAGKGKPA